ncbi:hypothetical protein [Anaerocolumna sedimenticola]|uniref:hypothetical protein n=1 Tax=Anaerocolumna sedimenticola TaxID=2696063 RepID=UPI00192A6C37|nr:hypothetical protein [Anaerocolumna sedimenticola]
METGHFTDYEIANINDSALKQISELEKNMCADTNKNIVLIAYQNKDGNKKES